MYYAPQPYKCIKCENEFQYSQSNQHSAPVLSEQYESDRGTVQRYMPVCPKCWGAFLLKNVGVGYCTVQWSKEGSDYELAKLKEKNT